MTAQEIRKAYLDFMVKNGHSVIPRALLVPQNDPTTLFTGSGMQPLIPYLLGEKHQNGTRLVNSQTCLRADDIDEVGDNRHTTFFEMLGNWSLGDYFKRDEINWLFEFLVGVVGLDPAKLFITCYIGNQEFNIPKDEEAAELWADLFKDQGIDPVMVDIGSEADGYAKGMGKGRIFFYEGKKNWWSRGVAEKGTPVGDPCGPDTEVFFRFDDSEHTAAEKQKYGDNCHPNCDCGRFVEIANSVFMAYKRTDSGFEPLAKPNVDFGGGLERIATAAIGSQDFFKISLLWPIIEAIEKLSGKSYDNHTESMRVISDHLRAATFLAVDGIVPSNKEQGYVMRRLIRRAIRQAFGLGIEQNFLEEIVPIITGLYKSDYPEVAANIDKVVEILAKEEKVFRQTLRKGLHEFSKLMSPATVATEPESNQKDSGSPVNTQSSRAQGLRMTQGEAIFMLYDTYGFPVELSVEEAFKQDIELNPDWRTQFDTKMAQQRQMSQTASKGTFKGGLGGQTEQHKKYHTATHLMYQALRQVLGDHVIQRGSNITEERLRFDFSHDGKVTPEQIKQVEDIVNEQIAKDLKVSFQEYPTKIAREEMHALGQFGDRYGET
ncbi:MAG: alanine--tRNA ligase-related protein, partial [Myxococcaceae bacterium]